MKLNAVPFLLLSFIAGCTSDLDNSSVTEGSDASEATDGLTQPGTFVQGDEFEEIAPGLCVSLRSYDVVARGAVGEYTETAVVVDNHCADRDMAIEDIQLLDIDGAFTIVSNLPDVIPAGGSVEILIGFEAVADMIHLGELLIVTDDERNTRQVASLFGVIATDSLRSGDPPVADAGPNLNIAQTGSVTNLDGSGTTDNEGDPLTYRWSFHTLPGGSGLTFYSSITNDNNVNASFTPDVDGTYRVRLVVTDGTSVDKDFANYTATASGTNNAPVADAGPSIKLQPGELATLDGSGTTDADGDPLTYTWTVKSVPIGSSINTASLSGANTNTASFTPDIEGGYNIKLSVSDGASTSKDFVAVNAKTNTPPSANAGPNQTVSVSTLVTLDATGSSDADGDTLAYTWSFKTIPGGSALTNSNITNRLTSVASFTPDVVGAWRIRLNVNDGITSDLDYVDITVE